MFRNTMPVYSPDGPITTLSESHSTPIAGPRVPPSDKTKNMASKFHKIPVSDKVAASSSFERQILLLSGQNISTVEDDGPQSTAGMTQKDSYVTPKAQKFSIENEVQDPLPPHLRQKRPSQNAIGTIEQSSKSESSTKLKNETGPVSKGVERAGSEDGGPPSPENIRPQIGQSKPNSGSAKSKEGKQPSQLNSDTIQRSNYPVESLLANRSDPYTSRPFHPRLLPSQTSQPNPPQSQASLPAEYKERFDAIHSIFETLHQPADSPMLHPSLTEDRLFRRLREALDTGDRKTFEYAYEDLAELGNGWRCL